MSIVSARDLSKTFGTKTLFDKVSITVAPGERIGLLGLNGTGKSTLLKVLAGREPYDSGILERQRDARIMYLAQEPVFPPEATPLQLVEEGLGPWKKAKQEYEEISARLADDHSLVDIQAALADTIEHLGGWERSHEVRDMLQALSVLEVDKPVGQMSGGERRRVALAQILVAKPTLAILDEPTNHLDADTISWLEDHLAKEFEGAVLMVTHDRYVLDAIATRIVELERGQLFAYEGNYADFVERKAERIAHDERVESNRQNFLRREVEWLRRGAKARTTKQKARIQRAKAAIAVEGLQVQERVALAGNAQRLGNTILDIENLHIERGGRVLIDDLTLHMTKGERIGIIGKNGAGKTTLLHVLMAMLKPHSGKLTLGAQTKIAYFDQARAELRDDWTVFDNVAERENALETGGITVLVQGELVPLRTYLERFLFDGTQQRQKVGALSGGERARVTLAKALKSGANLLLLDEPTNDLDTHTLDALEEMLETWPGCALCVCHDRYFLNRVATGLLVFEGDGKVIQYQGNYETYRSLHAATLKSNSQAAPPAPTPAPKEKKKGISYSERIELEGLMERISDAEAKAAAIEAQLADPKLYMKRGNDLKTLQNQAAIAHTLVASLVARWEVLEEKSKAL